MDTIKCRVHNILKENGFGVKKIKKIIDNINTIPCNVFIKYKGKKYILDIIGVVPANAYISLDRPASFRKKYGGFDIPDSDWI